MSEADGRKSLMVLGVCTFLAIVVVIVAWQKWGPAVTSQPKFKLTANHISVTPQPAWILEDVRKAAIQAGNLEELLVTDGALVEKIESAFGVQTWVSKVVRIRKRPGPKVEIELKYRRPVALVEVLTAQGQRALQPIDKDGYVLPEQFLHTNPALISEFLRISAGFGMPSGPTGTPWGDPYVVGAAKICNTLIEHWKELNLYRVIVQPKGRSPATAEYELQTRGRSRILWGRTVGHEQPGESDHDTKLRILLHHAGTTPLDGNGPVTIDLRNSRTAMAPLTTPQ